MTDRQVGAAGAAAGFPPPARLYLVALLPPALICAAAALQLQIDPAELFRDPLSVAFDAAGRGECCHAYYGAISLFGNLVWAGSAFASLFAASVLYFVKRSPNEWRFAASAGSLTAILVVDDVFQGHEFVYPTLFGIPEEVTIGLYAALLLLYLLSFRRRILDAGPGLLLIALFAFATSVASDMLLTGVERWHRFAEDGAKLVGIFCWAVFHWWAAWRQLAAPERPG